MLRSHHHLRGFVKLVLWDVYCVNGYGFFRLGYVGVGFEGNCDCWYGISYVGGWILCVWLFWHLLLILRNFLFPAGVGLTPGFLLCVCVRRPRAFRVSMSIVKLTRCTNVSSLFYFGMTLYMFRTVFPPIIRISRLYIQQQAYVK